MKKFILTIIAVLAFSAATFAQKGNIGFVYPTGAQRGTTITVTVGGQNLSKAKGIIISGKGVTGELIQDKNAAKGKKRKGKKNKNIGEEDNLQLADQVKFRLTVAPDAELGMRDLRLIMPNGMTNRLYFEVGELPDVCESPKETLSATSETLPVTFNGQCMRADVDRFRFSARHGQQLVIQVKARVFVPYMADAVPGWFQPIIKLFGPDGKEVAFNDDYTYHVDPVLFYKVPKSGDYEIEINDALYRGREDFVYRIDVGELPFITSISPIGGRVGEKCTVKLEGYNLKSRSVKIRPTKEGFFPIYATSKTGVRSNAALFDVSSLSVLKTRKLAPNTSRESPWVLSIGDICENVISEPLQQHWYEFSVNGEGKKKKFPIHIAVIARQVGAPTDARLTLYDSKGEVIKDVDDFENTDDYMTTHFADPEITVPLPAGTYSLRVIDSQGHGGSEYAYRLLVENSSPDFSVHIEPATFSVPENGTGIFNVNITRKQNFRGPVTVNVNGLPKGFKVAGNTIENGQKTFISITAPKGAEHQVVHPVVTATAGTPDGQQITREAKPVETMMQAFYYTHYMPMEEFRCEVGEEQPFRVIVENAGRVARLSVEKPAVVKVHIDRNPGFNSPVTLMLKSTMGQIKAEAVVIPEGESDGELLLTLKKLPNRAKDFNAYVVVSGVLKGSSKKIAGKGRNAFVSAVTAYAPVFEVTVPGGGKKVVAKGRAKGGAAGAKKGKK